MNWQGKIQISQKQNKVSWKESNVLSDSVRNLKTHWNTMHNNTSSSYNLSTKVWLKKRQQKKRVILFHNNAKRQKERISRRKNFRTHVGMFYTTGHIDFAWTDYCSFLSLATILVMVNLLIYSSPNKHGSLFGILRPRKTTGVWNSSVVWVAQSSAGWESVYITLGRHMFRCY